MRENEPHPPGFADFPSFPRRPRALTGVRCGPAAAGPAPVRHRRATCGHTHPAGSRAGRTDGRTGQPSRRVRRRAPPAHQAHSGGVLTPVNIPETRPGKAADGRPAAATTRGPYGRGAESRKAAVGRHEYRRRAGGALDSVRPLGRIGPPADDGTSDEESAFSSVGSTDTTACLCPGGEYPGGGTSPPTSRAVPDPPRRGCRRNSQRMILYIHFSLDPAPGRPSRRSGQSGGGTRSGVQGRHTDEPGGQKGTIRQGQHPHQRA